MIGREQFQATSPMPSLDVVSNIRVALAWGGLPEEHRSAFVAGAYTRSHSSST